jgi:hypothetical protein
MAPLPSCGRASARCNYPSERLTTFRRAFDIGRSALPALGSGSPSRPRPHGVDPVILRNPFPPGFRPFPPRPGRQRGRGAFDHHLLLALAAMAVERFEQHGIGAGELVCLV